MPLLLAAVLVTAALLRIAYGAAYLGVDSMWALQWGDDLLAARALTPTNGTTPHPLSNLAGAVAALGGRDADVVFSAMAYLGAGLLVVATGVLAARLVANGERRSLGCVAGAGAALIIASRPELLASTASGALDVWAAALVVAAVAAATPAAGWRVNREAGDAPAASGGDDPGHPAAAVLLLLAGLLRPEAWALALAWWAWRAWKDRALHAGHLALAVAAPLLWVLHDWVLTGDPLFAIHQTDSAAGQLRYVQDLARGVQADVERAVRASGSAVQLPLLALAVAAAGATAWRWHAERREDAGDGATEAASRRAAFALVWATLALYAALILLQAANGTLVFSRFALVPAALAAALVTATAATLAPRSWRPGWPVVAVTAIAVLASGGALRTSHERTAGNAARFSAARDALRPGLPCAPLVSPRTGLAIYASRWTGLPVRGIREDQPAAVPGPATYADVSQPTAGLFLRDPRGFPPVNAPGARAVRTTPGWAVTATCR